MKRRTWSIVLSALLGPLFVVPASAQTPTGTVSGRVAGTAANEPIAGASVTITGSTISAITAENGRYVLTGVPTGVRTVRVAHIGYTAQERNVMVSADEQAIADFSLSTANVVLSEVVVVGYGTQRRADLTGAVASVDSAAMRQTAVTSLEQGLQGRVAGVQVTQGDAAPGGGIRVQVRGTNSFTAGSAEPLYVIDGVPVGAAPRKTAGGLTSDALTSLTQTNPLASIAPSDIESIDILKDASATAIYGSRGANGVVMITTKHGARNSAGQFTLNYSQGAATVIRQIPVLNAYQYASYVNQAFFNSFGTGSRPYGDRPGSITPDSIRALQGAGPNWQDLIFRTATVRDAQAAFNGGDAFGSYAVSGNLLDQEGVIRGSQYRRGGIRANLDRNVKKTIRLTTNLSLTRSINDMVRTSGIGGYQTIGVVRQAVTYVPMRYSDTTSVRTEDPTTLAAYGSNPLRYTDEVSEADNITTGLGNLQITSSLGHGFGLDLSVGGNYWQRDYGEYLPSTVNEGRSSGGDAVHSNNNFANVLSTNLLRFNRDFDAHNRLDVVGGYEITNNRSNWLQNEVRGFPNDILGGNVLQSGTDPQRPVSGTSVDRLTSWLGRANYALFDRYLFTGTIRADGSSKFAENNKWAVFPALAFAWRTLDEPLLQNQTLLSELKVRMSYGKSGNQAIGAYQSSGALDPCTTTVGDVLQPCYAVSRLPNPNLKWETTSQYDVGVDFGMMKNRLTATADVYRKNTYDLLQSITVADNTGITSALINSGNVTNRGLELQVGYDLLTGQGTGRIGALKWNLSANASHNKNRIVSLGLDTATKQQFASRLGAGGGLEVTPFIQKPGVSIGSMYGYVSDGLIRTAADSVAYKTLSGTSAHIGDYRYRDLDGDGKLTSADQRVIGDANPRWTWGVSNRLSLGNFDVSAFVTAVVGGDIINTERIRYLDLNGTINVPSEFVRNSFDPTTNPNGIYPMIRQDRRGDNRFSDLFIEKGTYVRLKNVQVGYNLSLPHMPTARLYANGINLATWTKYKGFDPEVSAFGGSDRPGVDIGSYPNSKLVTVGLSTTF